jgi:hypothetical protein
MMGIKIMIRIIGKRSVILSMKTEGRLFDILTLYLFFRIMDFASSPALTGIM